MSRAAQAASEQAARQLEKHPRAQAVVTSGQNLVGTGARAVSTGAQRAAAAVPTSVTGWASDAVASMRTMVARTSRVGLSADGVVKLHKKRGHEVERLADLRALDLELVDIVRKRGLDIYYPMLAAASGAGAGLLITGGELVTVASAGAGAAPSATLVAGAFAGDAAMVLGLSSRAVGHISLLYGYDPEDPAEKLFIMSVVNVGTAVSASAKTAALSDVSRLTQQLVRHTTWTQILDASMVAQVVKRFSGAFGTRLTKQSLGKFVPAAGIILGSSFNWATLEGIVDAANIAYRRRFLLEKYPDLAEDEPMPTVTSDVPDDSDVTISVLDELDDAGGPDLADAVAE